MLYKCDRTKKYEHGVFLSRLIIPNWLLFFVRITSPYPLSAAPSWGEVPFSCPFSCVAVTLVWPMEYEQEWQMLHLSRSCQSHCVAQSLLFPSAVRMHALHTKWIKSERQRQTPGDITSMWNLKYPQMNLSVKQKQSHMENKWLGCQGGVRRGRAGLGVWAGRCKLLNTEWMHTPSYCKP